MCSSVYLCRVGPKDHSSILVEGVPDPVNIVIQDTLHCYLNNCSPCLIWRNIFSSDPENNLVWTGRVLEYELSLLMGVGKGKMSCWILVESQIIYLCKIFCMGLAGLAL